MSNWKTLNSQHGHLPGKFGSLQVFAQFKRWMGTGILTTVNALAISLTYLIHQDLATIIEKQNLPHYTPMVLFGVGIISLIALSILIHSQIVRYCDRFRPSSIMLTSDRDANRTAEALATNAKNKKQPGNDSFYKNIDVIEIPSDIFDSLQLLATNITWINLFKIKG